MSEHTPGGSPSHPDGGIAALVDARSAAGARAPEPDPAQPEEALFESDPDLMLEFISEARGLLDDADQNLLALEKDGTSKEPVNTIFRAFHTIKGISGFLGLDAVRHLAQQSENLLHAARDDGEPMTSDQVDVLLGSVDALRMMLDHLEESPRARPDWQRVVDGLVARLSGVAHDAPAARPDAAPAPGPPVTERPAAATTEATTEATRADRLDRLVETIDELVVVASMIEGDTRSSSLAGGSDTLRRLGKITRELQELATSLRMVPLVGTFSKLTRVVRDLSRKTGKKVEVMVSGDETELDKRVVDLIGDPLIHMVRNSVDHGLEDTAAQRLAAGKPETGRITLRAFHKGGRIFIEVEDDGKGLDREAILARAREQGIVGPDETMTDRQVDQLLFAPGLSTARQVTDLSGRGVGMDVVKRTIESLRGSIEVRSVPGQGSCFSLQLPLTLAIIDGLGLRGGLEDCWRAGAPRDVRRSRQRDPGLALRGPPFP